MPTYEPHSITQHPQLPSIGVIGLGAIGAPMACRLAETFSVVGYDVMIKDQSLPGVNVVQDLHSVARGSDIVCISLPTADASIEVVETLLSVRPSTTIVELSTIGMRAAQRANELVERVGGRYVDAPVSGGSKRARTGELTVMAAADPEAFVTVDPILRQLCATMFVVGDRPGLGQAMKVVNNVILACTLAITSEAACFGRAAGLELATMIDVLNKSSGRSVVTEELFPESILPGIYFHGADARILRKDVNAFIEGARDARTSCYIADATAMLWSTFAEASPLADYTRIFEYIHDLGSAFE